MKVKELMERLKNVDQDIEVIILYTFSRYGSAETDQDSFDDEDITVKQDGFFIDMTY